MIGYGWSDGDDGRWRDEAACRNSNPDLFFPVGSAGAAGDDIRAAKAICARCPVRTACLAFALKTNQVAGVWGGTSEEEREHLRRDQRRRLRLTALSR